MERDSRLALAVGVFVLLGLGALSVLVLSLSAERGIFADRYTLVSHFDNVQGLLGGAPVRLAGKDVGTVRSVRFAPFGAERPPVEVRLQIDREVQDRIRSDSLAKIGTIGLLGDTYIEIGVGTAEGRVLSDGEHLPAVSPLDFYALIEKGSGAIEKSTVALDNIASLAGNVNQVVADFNNRMGSRQVIEAFAAVTSGVESVTKVVEEIETGGGILHSLVYDRYEGGGVESIERSLATLENILLEIREGEGILHALIYEQSTEQDVVMQAIHAGARLNSILDKVDRGVGTLGLLLNDPTVYEDLKLLLGGAQRSLVVRSLVRLSAAGEE